MRVLGACVAGLVIALSGFPPLNNVPGLLHVQALPGLTLLTPVVLATVLMVWTSYSRSGLGRASPVTLLTIGLIAVGGLLSLTASSNSPSSTADLVLGVAAPAAVFLAVRRGRCPVVPLAGGFLTGLTAALIWADVVFLRDNGFPTPSKLFSAKFTNHAHDFHYYTLGNPDHTATFLLLPLAVCLVWLRDRSLSRRGRSFLVLATAVNLITVLLLYVRLPMVVAFVMLLMAVVASRLPKRIRVGAVVASAVGAVWLVAGSPSHYLTDLFSTARSTSGAVRVDSISDGLRVLGHHLVTGVGLGQYGATSGVPAHSSIVQAGAEMGVTGFLGLIVLTVALPVASITRARDAGQSVLARASLAGAAVYAVAAGVSAGADDGLFVGPVAIYGLALAIFAGIGLSPRDAQVSSPVAASLTEAARTIRARVRNWAQRLKRQHTVAWLAYGAVWIPIAAAVSASRLSKHLILSSSRVTQLNELLAAHHAGFGPLVEMIGRGNFSPSGPTDDKGAYLVTPWLSDLLHTSSINTIVRAFFLAGMCVMVAMYPLVIRRLTQSRFAAVISPVVVIAFFAFMTDDGFYWVPAATLAVCLPWLFVYVRDRNAPLVPLAAIAAVAGATQLFRSQTGVGLFIAALIVCVLASRLTRKRRLVAALVVVLAYLGCSSGVLDMALQSRAARMQAYPLTNNGFAGVTKWSEGGGHPFWHTVYIGLGVVKNPYGITYKDSVAAAYVRTVDAAAPFVGPEYEAILRKRVLHILVHNPGLVFRAEKRKLGEVLNSGLQQFWYVVVLFPLALALGLGRGRKRRYAVVGAPVAIIAILPPLVAIPSLDYEFPWLGLLATVSVLCGSWLLRSVAVFSTDLAGELLAHPSAGPLRDGLARARRGGAAVLLRLRRFAAIVVMPGVWIARGIGTVVRPAAPLLATSGVLMRDLIVRRRRLALVRSRAAVAVIAIALIGYGARAYLENWQSKVDTTSSLATVGAGALPFDAHLATPVFEWHMTKLPTGWTGEPGTTLQPGKTLRVTTTALNNAYQVQSPIIAVGPGRYVAAIRGELQAGGMSLGVLDVAADKWIQITPYQHSVTPTRATMTADFAVSTRKRVEIILSDLSTSGTRSVWLLNQALIAPQGHVSPGGLALGLPALNLPGATSTSPPGKARTQPTTTTSTHTTASTSSTATTSTTKATP